MNIENEFLKLEGCIRLIFCDGKKYPNYEDVDKAIEAGEAEITPWIKNLVVTTGKVAIARRLINAGVKSNEGIITYGAVGTNNATPVPANTQLGTEIARKLVSYSYVTTTQAVLRVFYTTSEAIGSLKEFGWFGEDATITANSGTLFNRVLIDREKTVVKTLTIEQKFTIAS